MAILNYSGILGAARGDTAGNRAINTMSGLANLGMQNQKLNAMKQQEAQQQAEQARISQARELGAELLRDGDPDKIAEFGIQNPDVMQDFIRAAQFKDKEAIDSRVWYAKDVLSGAVPPRQALMSRIEQVESSGGDASGLRQTLQGSDEDIMKAAERDLAVIAPSVYSSYKKATTPEESLTANQRDFDTYKQLKKENPEDAKVFGRKAGFLEDDNKRLFKIEDGVKYFSDGTEEEVKTTDKIQSPDMRKPMSYDQAIGIVDKAKEGQLKNAGFALTLNDGLKTIDSMTDSGYDPMNAAWVNKYLTGTTLGNLVMTEDDQKFVGSVEQMINAIARRETGAAITAFEKEDFFNRYMPVAGDKPERIKQKRNALERQFKSIRGQSGSVYEAVRTTQGFNDEPEEAPEQEVTQQVVIENHPQFGSVTEEDIQETMTKNNMTREEVLARLRGQ